jgi:hypothetical protein
MPRNRRRWVLAGRIICLLLLGGLVTYLVSVGLDKADKIASGVGAILALLALVAPYLLPVSDGAEPEAGAVHASGAGAVAISGSNAGEVAVEALGTVPAASSPPPPDGVSATGPASVAVGGRNTASIRTRFNGRTNAR